MLMGMVHGGVENVRADLLLGQATGFEERGVDRSGSRCTSFFSSMRRMFAARRKAASGAAPSARRKEASERLDALDDEEQVVVRAAAFAAQHGIDEVVTRALLAQLHLEAVVEEGEEFGRHAPGSRAVPSSQEGDRPRRSAGCSLRWR